MDIHKHDTIRLSHDNNLIVYKMSQKITSWLLDYYHQEIVIVCIGTDRSTGDALGPLIGTALQKYSLKNISVYGTLHQPIHALNLTEQLMDIYRQHSNPFVIAIDACLGKLTSVGDIIAGVGSIKPGAAVNKQLPSVGDMYLTGVINVSGFLEYTVLQSTRLSLVVDMANTIARIIHAIDRHLSVKLPSRQSKNNIS